MEVKKGLLGNVYIAYIEASDETKKYYDIFKKHSAIPKYIGKVFQYWFWWLGKNDEEMQKNYVRKIEPALRDLYIAQTKDANENGGEEIDSEKILPTIDLLMKSVVQAPNVIDGGEVFTPEIKEKIHNKLQEFKQILVNIRDDEEFKRTMLRIQKYRKSKGHSFSLLNSLLIFAQKPNATICNSKTSWTKYFNRTVNKDAQAIWILRSEVVGGIGKNIVNSITNAFLTKEKVKNIKELTPGQKQRLDVEIQKAMSRNSSYKKWIHYAVYDVTDTTLINGKEDHIQDIINGLDIPWFKEGQLDEKVRPIYNALKEICSRMNITLELAGTDVLGKARGMSVGGKIILLHNDGNDVYTTKTFVHELAHELLHQKYLKTNDKELEQYFVGQQEGRGVVERQAELTAWMVMTAFGFDTKTTSFNYAAMWGGNEDNMIEVFDIISGVANYLISQISLHGGDLTEDVENHTNGRYNAMDVARIIGVTSKFKEVLDNEKKKEAMLENFFRLSKIPKKNRRIL
jgi:hypothetical protein